MRFRLATMDDAKLLFEWRNDPLTRAMSNNTEPVPWEGHLAWLESRLARQNPHLYIIEDDGPIGTFRVDGDQVSYTIAPGSRRRGLATEALTLVRRQFGPLQAEIKPGNIASIKAAERAGMIVRIIE